MGEYGKFAKHAKDLASGRKNLRIFVPMCGKSVDLRWLADNGHTVVGVEMAGIAVKSFFEENQLEFTTETILAFSWAVSVRV